MGINGRPASPLRVVLGTNGAGLFGGVWQKVKTAMGIPAGCSEGMKVFSGVMQYWCLERPWSLYPWRFSKLW